MKGHWSEICKFGSELIANLDQDQQQHNAVHTGGVSRGGFVAVALALVTWDR